MNPFSCYEDSLIDTYDCAVPSKDKDVKNLLFNSPYYVGQLTLMDIGL